MRWGSLYLLPLLNTWTNARMIGRWFLGPLDAKQVEASAKAAARCEVREERP